MGTDNMNYKKLINYRLRDERALIFILSVMLVSIFKCYACINPYRDYYQTNY